MFSLCPNSGRTLLPERLTGCCELHRGARGPEKAKQGCALAVSAQGSPQLLLRSTFLVRNKWEHLSGGDNLPTTTCLSLRTFFIPRQKRRTRTSEEAPVQNHSSCFLGVTAQDDIKSPHLYPYTDGSSECGCSTVLHQPTGGEARLPKEVALTAPDSRWAANHPINTFWIHAVHCLVLLPGSPYCKFSGATRSMDCQSHLGQSVKAVSKSELCGPEHTDSWPGRMKAVDVNTAKRVKTRTW